MNCCDEIGRAAPHSAPPARVSHATVDFLIRGSAESSVSPRQCIISFLPPPLHGVGAGLDGQDFTCAECLSRAALSTAFLPAPVTPVVTRTQPKEISRFDGV